jgi:tetratricopeptide (TPR) repeat protein
MHSPGKRRAPSEGDWYERGLAALETGRAEEAYAAFAQALGAAPEGTVLRAKAHNKRGVAAMALGRRDEAFEDFCAALDCDERHAPAIVNIGNLFLEAGQVLDGIDYFEAALRADERCAGAHRGLGVALKGLGRHADAVRHLRAAVRLEMRTRR